MGLPIQRPTSLAPDAAERSGWEVGELAVGIHGSGNGPEPPRR